jgi:hypothetical protein
MRNFRNNNGYSQRKGKPSTLIALLIVGIGAYYYISQGNNKDTLIAQLPPYISKYFKTTQTVDVVDENIVKQIEVKQEPEIAKESIPKYVIVKSNTNAFTNYENGNQVGTIESGVQLSLLDYVEDSQGKITWLNVRSNGLSVWIANNNIEFKF